MDKIQKELSDISTPDSGSKMMGRTLIMLFTPGSKEKKPKKERKESGRIPIGDESAKS